MDRVGIRCTIPMSTPSTLSNESIAPSNHDAESQRAEPTSDSWRPIRSSAQFAGFWAAIVLPFGHLSILARGLASLELTLVFLALLALNLLALYVGHGYNQP